MYPPEARVAQLQSLRTHIGSLTRRFLKDARGNAAMIFALSMVAVIGAGGVGVDLARAMVAKNRMADALDAAALAVGSTQGLSNAQLQDMAQKYFNANYTTTGYGTPGPVSVAVDGNDISLSVSSSVPTAILPIIGIDTVPIGVSNQVTRALTKLRVALVLDNTGSMSETDYTGTSKISALISATHQLLTTLQNAATHAGDVQVALIPFSKDVNVGTSNVNASWIDWTDWEAAPPNAGTISGNVGPGSSCPFSTWSKGYGCQSSPTNGSSSTNYIPSSGAYAGYICPTVDNGSANSGRDARYYNGCYNSVATTSTSTVTGNSTTTTLCYNSGNCTVANYCSGYPHTSTSGNTTTTTTCGCAPAGWRRYTCTATATPVTTVTTSGPPYTHTWIPNAHSTWTGCVMDRTQNYDVGVTTPTSTATKFPAENSQYCVSSLMYGTLGYNWTALNNAVDGMSASGNTNQTIGLAWGWQALTQGAPLNAPAMDSDTTNVIILLSDGMNTQNRWTTSQSSIDSRMAAACSAAKAAHVEIYTVLVMAGNSSVLQDCATDSSKYFALTTAGAIITTFNQIGQTLANLHLSR